MKNIKLILILLSSLVITACGSQISEDPANPDTNQESTDSASENLTNEKENTDDGATNMLDEVDVNNNLPLTMEVGEYDKELKTIAYRLWFDLMGAFEANGQISDAFYTRYQVLEGDDEEFVAVVDFQVHLEEGQRSAISNWGELQEDGTVDNIVWKLRITKEEERTYTLENIEPATDKFIGLPPIQSAEEYQKEAGIEEPDENHRYEISDNTLKVTYNNGVDWVKVPAAIDDLFEGDYNGPKNYLIEGSYVIHPEKTAFIVGGHQNLRLLYTTDQGNSWNEVVIMDQLQGARMRLLGFTSVQDGYLIVTAGRTMSSEGNFIFKTNDGGKSWNLAGGAEETSLVTDGGFVNNKLGFLSFGSHNSSEQPPRPMLYRTTDGGINWEEVEVPVPDEFKGIFTVAEVPVFNGNQGILLVNQGTEGDYLGGNVLAKYTSDDEGKTWSFSSLVDQDRVLLK